MIIIILIFISNDLIINQFIKIMNNIKISSMTNNNETSPHKIHPNKIVNITFDNDHHIKYVNNQTNQNHNIFTSPKHFEKKASDMNNFTVSKFSPNPQRKTFAVGQNKYILTPKQSCREISPPSRKNGEESNFLMLSNQFKQQLQSHYENKKIYKKRQDSVRSGSYQTKQAQNIQVRQPVSNQQQLKKCKLVSACSNQNINNAKIIQQKMNMEKVLNKSIRKKSNYMSPNSKRGQSPDSTALSIRADYNDEVKSIQERKHSQNISNLPKENNKANHFNKLQIETEPSRSIKQQSIKKQTPKQAKHRSPSKDKVIIKKQPKYSYKFSDSNIDKNKQPKVSTSSGQTYFQDFPAKEKPPHKLSYQISQSNDLIQIKGKTPFQKKTETHESANNQPPENKITQFTFGKVIGTGKFGEVYEAKHKKTGFLVALKKIYKQKIKEYNLQKQLVEEIRLQAYTSHPNIVNMYGIFSDTHHIYLILQYMEGGTLFDFLSQSQKLPPKQVSLIMKQVSLAVKYLHKNQIAHRDIKPENILFSHGVAKLCDFGWSARVIDKRKTYCGTFDYVPPEMLQRKQYDQSVDLWCLGVLMYQLLTGKVPFEHKQRTVLMNRIINVDKQKIEYPDYICQEAIEVIQHLLRKNPHERTKTSQLLEYKFFKMKFQ